MLREQADNNDTVSNDQNSNDEEQYQRLFKKIARDFVCRADLERSLKKIQDRIENGEELEEDVEEDSINATIGAILKAIEYKANLSLPKHKRIKYKDIIEDDE